MIGTKILLGLCALAAPSFSQAIEERAVTGPFTLYAYGSGAGIGGLPVYYADVMYAS